MKICTVRACTLSLVCQLNPISRSMMATDAGRSTSLKRKSRSPSTNNAFACPRPKKQRTESPTINVTQSDSDPTARVPASVRSQQIPSKQHNASCCYLYDERGIIPKAHLSQSKRIEVRVPISSLSPHRNKNIYRRFLWGGGAINEQCYSSDSDIVSILYHQGFLSKYPMDCGHDRTLDPFTVLNHILSQNGNQRDDGFPELFIRTSSHKLSVEEMECEQQRGRNGKDMIGIAAILEVLPPLKGYESVVLNGMYSRKWIGNELNEEIKSLRLLHIIPLWDYGQFIVDGVYVLPMERLNVSNERSRGVYNSDAIRRDVIQSLMMRTDQIGMTFNSENRPCLQYNIAVVGNANLLMNRVENAKEQKMRMERRHQRSRSRRGMDGMHGVNADLEHSMFGGHDDEFDGDYKVESDHNHDDEKRFGHLLQWRLQRFCLMMESAKNEVYQLMQSAKGHQKRYEVIWMNARKQKQPQKIAEDLRWEHLKWSKKGLMVKDTLYCIDRVWLIRRGTT